MISNKQGLFLVEVTWLIWKLVFHTHIEIINMLSPKQFLWCNEESEGTGAEVGHAEKTDSRNLFIS